MPSKFGHRPKANKGKFHPSAIGPGQAGVKQIELDRPGVKDVAGSGKRMPAGVRERSGAEQLGTKTQTKQATAGKPGGRGGKDRLPIGVRSKYTGRSA